jgi:hypothetical protein
MYTMYVLANRIHHVLYLAVHDGEVLSGSRRAADDVKALQFILCR